MMIEILTLLSRIPQTKYIANCRITRSRAPKHWFDNDADDRSIHSSDGETITGKEEKEEYV
jgi:hypothetical protein